MTFETIKTFFEEIIGSSIDQATAYSFMFAAITSIEDERDWEYLKAWDTSLTFSSSDTYLSMKALPTLWRKTLKIVLGTKGPTLLQIPFEKRMEYQDSYGRFYVDVGNSQYALTGRGGSSQTINHCYKKTTTEPSYANRESSPSMPSRFHPLIYFRMAVLYSSALDDSDDTTFQLAPGQQAAHKTLLNSMIAWDDDLKLSAMEGEQVGDNPPEVPLGQM